jgi:hypothetical protein
MGGAVGGGGFGARWKPSCGVKAVRLKVMEVGWRDAMKACAFESWESILALGEKIRVPAIALELHVFVGA